MSGAAQAADGEVCVECTAPEKVYVCQVEKSEKVASYRAGVQALQYLCVTDIARVGGHVTCKARRNADNCLGTIHNVSIAEARRTAAEAVSVKPDSEVTGQSATTKQIASDRAQPPRPTEPQKKEPPQLAESRAKEPPRTMKELAERTIDASGDQAKAAGDAVASGLSNTWKCVTTLFQKC